MHIDKKKHGLKCKTCDPIIGNTLTTSSNASCYSTDILKSALDYGFSYCDSDHDFFVYKVSPSTEKFSHRLYINKKTFDWQIYINDINVTYFEAFKDIGETLNNETVYNVLSHLNICKGNTDFSDVCRIKSKETPAIFLSRDGQCVTAYEETNFYTFPTVRHSRCSLLLSHGDTCDVCSLYKRELQAMNKKHKVENDSEMYHPRTKNSCLTTEQTRHKYTTMYQEKYKLKRKLESLESRVYGRLEIEGEEISERISKSLLQITKDCVFWKITITTEE
ncbi:unnamed protein product [Mytilus coruscus]|uniref:Uncharacterized protein n=1 Tax=Mytilus coruscus TaxID=42192 RepID=A0A6J8F061_MYTCO|nr:unnamed protein product [Mytilus coruscus]